MPSLLSFMQRMQSVRIVAFYGEEIALMNARQPARLERRFGEKETCESRGGKGITTEEAARWLGGDPGSTASQFAFAGKSSGVANLTCLRKH
jgi:hypothetical protein